MKNISYIIKRIVIGVGIALVLAFLRRGFLLDVYAIEVDGYPIGEDVSIIDNTTSSYTKTITGSPWSSLAGSYGYINGTFSISKVDGSPTSINVTPKQVYVNSGNTSWVCSIGSNSLGNSTFNQATYSYKCPIQMTSSGLNSLVIQFVDIQTNFPSMYRLVIGSLVSFEIHQDANINVDTSGTTNAINNQITNDNQNTQDIINNQNQNKQDIINNQNQNTDKQIESQKVCKLIDKSNIVIDNKYLSLNGDLVNYYDFGITDYVDIYNSKVNLKIDSTFNIGSCYYDETKTLINCMNQADLTLGQDLVIPNNARYMRFSIRKNINAPQFTVCINGNQAIVDSQNQINNTLNDDNVSSDTGSSFFNDFQANSHGLSGVITAPLRLINSLSSSSCSPLSIPLPFVNQNVSLPCMSTIYSTHFPTFLSLYQLITTGIIGYWVLVKLFGHVKGMQSPNDDRIEVFDL